MNTVSKHPYAVVKGLTLISSNKAFEGYLNKYSFRASSLGGLETSINVFLPAASLPSTPVPTLIFLAGLTCNEDTGPQKMSILTETAAAYGLAIVFPDTSPRGANIPGEGDSWAYGLNAGAYLDATRAPWSKYYRMETFITVELLEVLRTAGLPLRLERESLSILGHSMGGHGAISLYLKHPELFRCASAFAPAASPGTSEYGRLMFPAFLEGGMEEGKKHDSTELIKKAAGDGRKVEIIVDMGTEDGKAHLLMVPNFAAAVKEVGYEADGSVIVTFREGYDHSFSFVNSFAKTHVEWHAKRLKEH